MGISTNILSKVALAGGGAADDSRLLDEVFASWVGPHGKMLYLPVALRGIRPFESCLAWIRSTFAPWPVADITMWEHLSEHRAGELDAFDGVYVGGGNTYSLLAQFRESGFDRYLLAYGRRGGAVYGGSAGAALLGMDIRSVAHIDHNDMGLTETKGLNLAMGHAVWVHYEAHNDVLIDAYVGTWHQPVLAISERSGIVIDGDGMRCVGFEPAFRFDTAGKHRI